MTTNIKRFPYSRERYRRLNAAEGRVQCLTSSRSLMFRSSVEILGEPHLLVDVVTVNEEGEQRTLCSLTIEKAELLEVLARIPEA